MCVGGGLGISWGWSVIDWGAEGERGVLEECHFVVGGGDEVRLVCLEGKVDVAWRRWSYCIGFSGGYGGRESAFRGWRSMTLFFRQYQRSPKLLLH